MKFLPLHRAASCIHSSLCIFLHDGCPQEQNHADRRKHEACGIGDIRRKLEALRRLHQSGNDAALALAIDVAGSEAAFVERMNETARALGLQNTRYA
ncbi:MAG: hypothetical protein II047_02230, partial [Bacteroidales bacterium]|nr:hypothetical protein [Bacteroidales bacterium]